MCGIFCCFCISGVLDKLKLDERAKHLQHRGPDAYKSNIYTNELTSAFMGFHRLSIVGLSNIYAQPFEWHDLVCIANAEIYNFKDFDLKDEYQCDCEVILPLFDQLGRNIDALSRKLDGEYAIIIYDKTSGELHICVDQLRIRPLFVGYDDNFIYVASEIKSLAGITEVIPFPAGTSWSSSKPYLWNFNGFNECCQIDDTYKQAKQTIQKLLINSVLKKYNMTDAPVGFMLSGGLDSSLCCAIASREAARLNTNIKTFSVGFSKNSVDLIAARKVSKFLNTEHHELIISLDEGIAALDSVIYYLETFDTTTIRAAVGMFLLAKWIRENTKIKVLITGEVADELFEGYIYWKYAPNSKSAHRESLRLLNNIYMFDGLRADRCLAAHSIENRVPFFDKTLISYVLSLNPDYINPNCHRNIEKKILRDAFYNKKNEWLPYDILYRHKEAFSDGVSAENEWISALKAHSNIIISDKELDECAFEHVPPRTKEELLYRKIFEKYFAGSAEVIPYYWLPNIDWFDDQNNTAMDSSASSLSIYVKN